MKLECQLILFSGKTPCPQVKIKAASLPSHWGPFCPNSAAALTAWVSVYTPIDRQDCARTCIACTKFTRPESVHRGTSRRLPPLDRTPPGPGVKPLSRKSLRACARSYGRGWRVLSAQGPLGTMSLTAGSA